jgi:hypothetical protein
MNPCHSPEALSSYPEWHKQPLRLTLYEMKDPWLVIRSFFTTYNLFNIRTHLKLLLQDAIEAEAPSIQSYFHTLEDLERLTEATWLLFRQYKKEQGAEK